MTRVTSAVLGGLVIGIPSVAAIVGCILLFTKGLKDAGGLTLVITAGAMALIGTLLVGYLRIRLAQPHPGRPDEALAFFSAIPDLDPDANEEARTEHEARILDRRQRVRACVLTDINAEYNRQSTHRFLSSMGATLMTLSQVVAGALLAPAATGTVQEMGFYPTLVSFCGIFILVVLGARRAFRLELRARGAHFRQRMLGTAIRKLKIRIRDLASDSKLFMDPEGTRSKVLEMAHDASIALNFIQVHEEKWDGMFRERIDNEPVVPGPADGRPSATESGVNLFDFPDIVRETPPPKKPEEAA